MNAKIRNYVVSQTKSFWLSLDVDQLSKRLDASKKRPLLVDKNIKLTLEKIYKERKKIYSLANFKIDCNNLNTSLIVSKIVKLYKND